MFQKLKFVNRDLKRDLQVYRLALQDPRTPRAAGLLLRLAVGYAVFPFDLIPDFLPIIGHFDDAYLVPTVIRIALRMVPDEVMEECRLKVPSKAKSAHPRRVGRHRRASVSRRLARS
jgi:uncharacterized membrane protein YkvA (DUF1232 family)